MQFDCYILASRKDDELAEKVAAALEGAGFGCFFPPRDLISDESDSDAEKKAAIASSYTTVLVYTDDANMEPQTVLLLDHAAAVGSEVVTLRLSNSPPLSRTGFYTTIPYTVDAREGAPEDYFDTLTKLVGVTVALVKQNRTKTTERAEKKQTEPFSLPGFNTGKWYLTLVSGILYAAALLLILLLFNGLRYSGETFASDLVFCIAFALLFLLPVLLLGNFLGLRDRLPLFKMRQTGPTLLGLLIVEAAVFGIYALVSALI